MDNAAAVASLAALAQDTRLAIYRALVQAGPAGLSVGEIAAHVTAAPATLSFHLKELAAAGLASARQDGRFVFYSANYAHMSALIAFLSENCCARDDGACAAACPPRRSKPPPRPRSPR